MWASRWRTAHVPKHVNDQMQFTTRSLAVAVPPAHSDAKATNNPGESDMKHLFASSKANVLSAPAALSLATSVASPVHNFARLATRPTQLVMAVRLGSVKVVDSQVSGFTNRVEFHKPCSDKNSSAPAAFSCSGPFPFTIALTKPSSSRGVLMINDRRSTLDER